ncbi:multiubiquitin domain-containing protein [Amycolatopsis sp. TRM77291]
MTADTAAGRKHYEIVVNGREKVVDTDEVTFEQLVHLAFNPVPSGPNWVFTVTYRRGHGHKPEGTLKPGESVKVKKGMIFNVTATDKS